MTSRIFCLTRGIIDSIILFALRNVFGPLAQLGERLHGMEEVIGSIPTRSTKTDWRRTTLRLP